MMLDRRHPALVAFAAAAAGCSAMLTGAGGAVAGTHLTGARSGTWGTAREVPGTATLNRGGNAQLVSVSCASAGNCSAGGYYTDGSRRTQAFVVSEVNGTWHTAIQVPGTSTVYFASIGVTSVSCASAGNCVAGGSYQAESSINSFVASEVNGTWHTAVLVPGLAARNFGDTAVTSVSCRSAGNCSIGGYYTDSSAHLQTFVAGEVNGTWHTAIEVPGSATLNRGGNAEVTSVSCASAGNCGAGGNYRDGSGHQQAFVTSEVNGTWHTAIEVPGTPALNQGGGATIESVSCRPAGTCSAGGYYAATSGGAFVAREVNGTWNTAQQVFGSAPLNPSDPTEVWSVSCASAGNCSASGNASGNASSPAFVATETNGAWGTAIEVPGIAALNAGRFAEGLLISCASAGACSVSGNYADSSHHWQAFVASEAGGTWANAIEVPGTASLNRGGHAQALSLSCATAGSCTAGGYYTDSSGHAQAFVDNET